MVSFCIQIIGAFLQGHALTRPINVDHNKRREKRLATLIMPSYWRRYILKTGAEVYG